VTEGGVGAGVRREMRRERRADVVVQHGCPAGIGEYFDLKNEVRGLTWTK
jgi:phage shock protein PspC (stress-responsive transcriptional regulator)